MRNNKWTRTIAVVLMVIMCALTAASACAGSSIGGNSGSGNSQLNSLPPFKFAKHLYGIGYGNCPVYSAPSEYSYRGANGKASVATSNGEVDEAGWVDGWLLVRYEIKGGWRVGYIPPKYVRGFQSSMAPHFGWVSATANDTIYVTDNVYSHYDAFATLAPGENFHVLSRYNYYASEGYDWYYIECTVDGQVARGFIETSANFTVD